MTENVYAVRTSENFATQSEAAYDWLEEKADPSAADDWLAGLQEVKASLATLPQRCPIADENRIYQKKHLGPPLRVALYRRGRNTWRLLFTIHEAENGEPAYVKLHGRRINDQEINNHPHFPCWVLCRSPKRGR